MSVLGEAAGCEATKNPSWLPTVNMPVPGNPKTDKDVVRVSTELDPWTGKCSFVKSQQL